VELWQAVLLGLVEGITEYLPVSSTGHLIITSALLGLDAPGQREAIDAFEVVIQGGAILAVLGLYWPRVVQMLRGLIGKDPAGLRLAINLLIAFIPAAIIGKLLEHWIESKLFYAGPVIAAFVVGGIYMIVVDRLFRKRPTDHQPAPADAGAPAPDPFAMMTPAKSLLVGLMQCVAMWPGTSRSMMTITAGMFVGLPTAAAAEFSFLLGLPTLGAATLYKLAKNLKQSHDAGTPNLFHVLGVGAVVLGITVATVSAALAVKWLVGFLNRRGLAPFGWYRIVLALLLLALAWRGTVMIQPKSLDAETRRAAPQDLSPAPRSVTK
jgi:undecaprenyl-diphosphatase